MTTTIEIIRPGFRRKDESGEWLELGDTGPVADGVAEWLIGQGYAEKVEEAGEDTTDEDTGVFSPDSASSDTAED